MPLYWIALNEVNGLGPVRIRQLLEAFGSPEAVFRAPAPALRNAGLMSADAAAQLADPQLLRQAEDQMNRAAAAGVRILTLADRDYPPLLREIFAPPPVLYVKGTVDVFSRHAVAIVGMRNPGAYGKSAAEHLVAGLVKRAVPIISGLALGIDAIAHKTCVDLGGATVAVLGSGIDTLYPPANRGLAERIPANGAIVSEFPLGTRPLPYNFPRRNRIISGLAAGVVVVEAGKKSGSLITAHYALQQGREVFAVPGSIFSEKSDGAFTLIKNGAIPVQSAQDILDAIELITHSCVKTETVSRVTRIPPELLSTEETLVAETLSDSPMRLDQIAEKIENRVANLFSILLNLELKGVVQQVSGQQYVRV